MTRLLTRFPIDAFWPTIYIKTRENGMKTFYMRMLSEVFFYENILAFTVRGLSVNTKNAHVTKMISVS